MTRKWAKNGQIQLFCSRLALVRQAPSTFDKWLSKQKDRQAVRAIAMRIARAEQGNLGGSEPVGEGVSEMLFS